MTTPATISDIYMKPANMTDLEWSVRLAACATLARHECACALMHGNRCHHCMPVAHSIHVSIDRRTIRVDGKLLAIIDWPRNDVALTDDGGFFTIGPDAGRDAFPCISCGNIVRVVSDVGECVECQRGWFGADEGEVRP